MKFNVIIFGLLAGLCLVSCEKENRKIKLSNDIVKTQAGNGITSTIYIEPDKQQSLAVMFFQNKTGDQSLEWLQKGLTEMFIRSLSQSRALSVTSSERLFEIIERLGEDSAPEEIDFNMAAAIANEAHAETILMGNITKSGDSLRINIQLRETDNGLTLREESVEAPGLENLLAMVDDLTQKVKNELQTTHADKSPAMSISDLSTQSLDAWRYYTAGMDYNNKFMTPEAFKSFQNAVRIDSNFVAALYQLCMDYLGLNDAKTGFRLYHKLLTLQDKATEKENFQISVLGNIIKGDQEQVYKLYESWLEKHPTDVDATYDYATMLFSNGIYNQAIDMYEKTLDFDPKYRLAMNQLGYSYAYTGRYNKALETMDRYEKIASGESNPLDSHGEIYWMMGDYAQAGKYFKQAIEINNRFNSSRIHLGSLMLDKGDYGKAADYFEKLLNESLDSDPKNNYHFLLGNTYLRMGDKEKAFRYYFEALNQNPPPQGIIRFYYLAKELKGEAFAKTLMDSIYTSIRESIDLTAPSFINAITLATLSLETGLYVKESTAILENIIEHGEQVNIRIISQFILSLLYGKTGSPGKIAHLWEDINMQAFFTVLQSTNQLTYYNVWKYYGYANILFHNTPDGLIAHYLDVIDTMEAANFPSVDVAYRMLLSDLYLYKKQYNKAREQCRLSGIPLESEWLVIGPFDNKDGFRKAYPPERRNDLNPISYQGNMLSWQPHTDSVHDGFINLNDKGFDSANWSVHYALIDIYSPQEMDVEFRTGSNESIKVWLNRSLVWAHNRQRRATIDNDIIPVSLSTGRNRVLVKVVNQMGEYGFYFRVTDREGLGLSNIQFLRADANELALGSRSE